MNPKTEPAYPNVGEFDRHGDRLEWPREGLTQYAEVAARFHAAFVVYGYLIPMDAASLAFNHADAFFAELAKRTAP